MGIDIFEALADPVRRDLVRQLVAGPARVVDLTRGRGISRPAVSRHLRLLTEAGLTTVDDRGRERHYRLDPAGLGPVRTLLTQLTPATPWPRIGESALDALDLEVRRTVRDRTLLAEHDRPDEETA